MEFEKLRASSISVKIRLSSKSQKAFDIGYYLYGVNLLEDHMNDHAGNVMFPESKFHYSGNFVTINLKELRNEFLTAKCRSHYYGAEAFWGTLCGTKKGFLCPSK